MLTARAAVGVLFVLLALSGCTIVARTSESSTEVRAGPSPGPVQSFCFDNVDEVEVTDPELDVEEIDCSRPHDNEAFASFTVSGVEYPGEDVLREQAVEQCAEPFERFVGLPPSESKYHLGASVPSEKSWESGARSVTCVVSGDMRLRGTLAGRNE